MAKIKRIEAENFGLLRLFSLTPDALVVRMFGMNASGKSTGLKGLRAVLLGERDGAGDVVTHGQKRGTFTVELEGGLTATMKWSSASGSRTLELVKIDNADGSRAVVTKPSEFLKQLVGPFHDVGQIVRIDTPEAERELHAALLRAGGISVKDLDEEIEAASKARAVANANLRRLEAQIAALERPDPELPKEEQSAAALIRQRDEVKEQIDARANAERRHHELEKAKDAAAAHVALLERSLADARRAQADADAALVELEIPAAPEMSVYHAIGNQLAQIDETNAKIRAAREWNRLATEIESEGLAASAENERIAQARTAKVERLKTVTLPIEGAAVTEEGVTLNGERFHNLSTGQRLTFGCALGCRTRGKLDALFLDNAEALDAEHEAMIEEIAEREGVQIFMASTVKEATGGLYVTGGAVEIETAIAPVAEEGAAA